MVVHWDEIHPDSVPMDHHLHMRTHVYRHTEQTGIMMPPAVRSGMPSTTQKERSMEYVYRQAAESDIQALTDIYNAAVVAGGSSADIAPRTIEQRRA